MSDERNYEIELGFCIRAKDAHKIAKDLLEHGRIETTDLFNWLHERLMDEAGHHNVTLMVIARQVNDLHHDYQNVKDEQK